MVVFLRHGSRRNFPLFFVYNIYALGASIVRISTVHHEVAYFWVYLATDVIYGVFALLVLQSIFQQVWEFKPAIQLLLVPIWLLVISGLVAWWGMLHPIAVGKLAGLYTAFIAFMAGVHWTELAVFAVALAYIGKFTRYQIGILLGFAMSSIAEALAYLVHAIFGAKFINVLSLADPAAYMAAVGIWLATFMFRPSIDRTKRPDLKKEAQKYDMYAEILAQYHEWMEKISKGLGLRWRGKKRHDECASGARQLVL
ncbi:MAG TPA: hypothetical protein VG649_22635 [Candidatus Angelobacter sp.]|nr:hypothetical protein [Candidatus Angelobacter sp.]